MLVTLSFKFIILAHTIFTIMGKLQRLVIVILVLGSLTAISCNQPACKSNTILEQFAFDSNEYKNELAKQIDSIGQDKLSYSLENYCKKGEEQYIVVVIKGAGLCAKGALLVNDWSKLAGIRKNSGLGYSGAELRGLTLQISQNTEGKQFIFTGLDKIID